MDRRESKWTIDKSIPVSVILVLLAQTVAVVFWFARLENRVANLEQQRIEAKEQTSSLPERITRLEVQQSYANQLLADLLREFRKVREQ